MKTKVTWLVLFGILSLVFSGTVYAKDVTSYSGFLTHYPKFKPIPGIEGAWGWDTPGFQQKNYNKIFLDSIEIWLAPDSKYKGINPDQMKVLADGMRAALVDALDPDYPVVSKTGAGVLRGRFAITNVYLGKPKHQIGQYTPIGLLFTEVKKLAGKSRNLSLKNAVVELEMLDSVSGKRLAVRIDTKPLRSVKGEAKEMSWEAIEESLRFYGKQFRARVDQNRAK